MAQRYPGNVPANVAKDAKYSVVRSDGEWCIRLVFRLSFEERALMTTTGHPDLIELVNGTKRDYNGVPGGAFYINEYRHVLVPTEEGCMYAGDYRADLVFRFEGHSLSARPDPEPAIGTEWTGPRVGIPYTLTADGTDIRYKAETRPNVLTEKRLSREIGSTAAHRLAATLTRHKPGGGRIYINEARHFFAPVDHDGEWTAIYLGSLGDSEWFADPLDQADHP